MIYFCLHQVFDRIGLLKIFIIISVRKTIHCVDVRWKECTYVSAPLAVVLTLILCFEALLFLLFTAIMFCVGVHILHLSPVLARINREYVHSNCCLDSRLFSVSLRAMKIRARAKIMRQNVDPYQLYPNARHIGRRNRY